MGNIIASKCRICNFENTFSYGGNRFNYLTNCPVPAINTETEEFENYWQLYDTVKNQAIKDISGGSVARQCREFNALVTRRMYEAGMSEEKKNWTSWDK